MPRITRPSDWNPRSIRCALDRLRRNKPALTSATSESATWPATSRWRTLYQRVPPRQRRALLELGHHVGPRCLDGGRQAEENAGGQRDQRREGQARGRRSRGRSKFGWMNGGRYAQSKARAQYATRRPPRPPSEREQHALGEELPDQPPAAGANREAHGNLLASRAWARASSRLATLAHAISRTSATTVMPDAARQRQLLPELLAGTRCSAIGSSPKVRPRLSVGKSRSSALPMASALARACSSVTPSFRRATP